ncbi:galactose-1-phosphate uridylyltransferase [Candidatus Woesearchaeota archaeon]|jgi:UDPglucose--hexose-1-phosphate uridylyltransferase|nr:galactose-1-phosphate uridylyltransferase [Candidatus Woesearchaeota archaeon]
MGRPQLRKDYLLERWVIVSESRGKRPHEFAPPKIAKKDDPFAPGNEKETPPTLGSIGEPWEVRWFANKFAAVATEGNPKLEKQDFFQHADAVGHHEVIVETPSHKQLGEMSEKDIEKVLTAYKDRLTNLKDKNIGYVSLFKNSGPEAGTSIVHSHTQLITTPGIPPLVQEKVEARNKFIECPHCKIIDIESKSERFAFATEDWVAFCPFAPRFKYELWLYPKKHVKTIEELDLKSMAKALSRVLKKVHKLGSYNMLFFYSPDGEDLHFHIELCPRLATWAGFELGSDIIITSVTPEEAAKYYR